MFNFRIISVAVMSALISCSSQVLALGGDEGGAGGNGILIDGKPYLLDLVEYGIENNVVIDPVFVGHPYYQGIRSSIKALGDVNPLGPFAEEEVANKVTLKLLEIGTIHSEFAIAIWGAMTSHGWYIVNQSLIDAWSGTSTVDVSNRISLAVRRDKEVRINRTYWQNLNADNKVALLFHEAIFSLVYPKLSGDTYRQDSNIARRAVGAIFQANYSKSKGSSLLNVVHDGSELPILDSVYVDPTSKVSYAHPTLWPDTWGYNNFRSLDIKLPLTNESILDLSRRFCKNWPQTSRIIVRLSKIKLSWYASTYVKPAGFLSYESSLGEGGLELSNIETTSDRTEAGCLKAATLTLQNVKPVLEANNPWVWPGH